MNDPKNSDAQIRRRWINLGEFVAVAGLVISALALWNSWGSERKADQKQDRPAAAEATPRAIPLVLRGTINDEGKSLALAPVERGHALDSMTISAGGRRIDVGSDGLLSARAVQSIVGKRKGDEESGMLPVKVEARYIEAGEDRRGGGTYRLRYRWTGGGLFGGSSLRLTGWSRG